MSVGLATAGRVVTRVCDPELPDGDDVAESLGWIHSGALDGAVDLKTSIEYRCEVTPDESCDRRVVHVAG